MLSIRVLVLSLALTALGLSADGTFEKTAAPVFSATCSPCHNEQLASGGLNIAAFTHAQSLTESREGWEIILRKVRAGEMPPKGVPRPAQLDDAIQFIQAEFDKADRSVKPDPGRVTARRLNRAEYTNTIPAASTAPSTPTPSATCWPWISTPRKASPPTTWGAASITWATC
ncbi:exported hypothetical protein [Candidatus Sulfopaludibacter sp. SbA3]|nr:exported hypothetical protein [Candidatus Sulfopaludibacter sp. SbA3]